MSKKLIIKQQQRQQRKKRVRAKVYGTSEKPRLSVFRSLTHFYLQLIDDQSGKTLASAKDAEVKGAANRTELAGKVGELLAEKAKAKGITTVVFDKSGYKYHGRVKAAAEGARKGGLEF